MKVKDSTTIFLIALGIGLLVQIGWFGLATFFAVLFFGFIGAVTMKSTILLRQVLLSSIQVKPPSES